MIGLPPSLTLSWPLFVVSGAGLFFVLAGREGIRRGLPPAELFAALALGTLGALAGARLGTLNPMEGVTSGRTILGVIAGAIVGFAAAARWLRFSRGSVDTMAVAAPVGMAVGRIGCIVAGCCRGRPTELPWGVAPRKDLPGGEILHAGVPLHPVQAYEAILVALLALALYRAAGRTGSRPGLLFTLFVTGYGAVRWGTEFLGCREPRSLAAAIWQSVRGGDPEAPWRRERRRAQMPAGHEPFQGDGPERAVPTGPLPLVGSGFLAYVGGPRANAWDPWLAPMKDGMCVVVPPHSTPPGRAHRRRAGVLRLGLLPCIFLPALPSQAMAQPELPLPRSVVVQSGPRLPESPNRHEAPTFRHLTIADGLSQNAVLAIVQDRRGFLWFGTKDGLNRYDGHSFRVYRHDPFDPSSLSSSAVTALFEDRDGDLWVGTEAGGLDRFDRDRETFHRHALDAGSQVNAIVQDRDGDLWVATNGEGLARLASGVQSDPASPVQWYRSDSETPTTLGSDFVHALLEDAGGSLWVGHGGGLDRLDPGARGFASYPVDPEAPVGLMDDRGVTSLLEDREGRIWMGMASGISVLDPDRSRIIHHRHRYETFRFGWGQVRAILEDRDGLLWLATPSELMRFDPATGTFAYLRHDPLAPRGINSNMPSALLQDRSEVIWVGTNGFGLNVHDPKANRFGTFRRPEDRPWRHAGFSVYTLFEDSSGTVWIDAGLLYRWDRSTGAFTSFETSSDRPDDFGNTGVWAMVEEPRGYLWAGGYQGLFRYEIATGRVRNYRHDPDDPNGLPETAVYDVLLDPSGSLWVVTERWLSELVDPEAGRFRSYRYDDRVASGRWTFPSLVRAPDGVFWFGSSYGLVRFDPATRAFRHFRNDPDDRTSLGHNVVRALLLDPTDPGGTLWVGTVGGGLNRFDLESEQFTHYTTAQGLPNDVVYAILPDDEGHLWLSTNRGLSRFDPATGAFRNFDAGDGLQSDEFNSGAAFRSASGELFFGGIYGFNYFRPEEIRDNPHLPEVVITGLRRLNRLENVGDSGSVLERSIAETRELRLSHRDNVLTFEFAALDYSAPSKNRYAYRMQGFNDTWIEAGTGRTATFTNLPPGSYTFEVRGANNDGLWNDEGASLALVILPPWWRTRWALGIYALLALATGLGLRRYEMHRLRLEYRLAREHEEAEQLRELDQARSRFFANVSHEFRTPLTLTLGPLDDLRSGFHGPLPAPVTGQVELARRNAGRVLELIDQLLEVARLEAGNTVLRAQALDACAFVRQTGTRFDPLAERRGVELQVDVPETEVEVFADPAHLEKVLANLLANAFKFTPSGGCVTLELAVSDTDLRMAVTDTGPGIPPEELPRVFDRFFRGERPSEEAQPGTGIGLALVRELVQLHGGTVNVESTPGAGSRFTVTLRRGHAHLRSDQLVDGPTGAPATFAVVGAAAAGDADPVSAAYDDMPRLEAAPRDDDVTTVLIAEDNPELRAYIRAHLEPQYRIVEAADGRKALAMVHEHLPDLVISDVMMPGMDGYELCRRLKTDPDTDFIPVILLTARAAPEDRMTGLEGRADAYLTKPFDMEELRTWVRNLIEVRERFETRFSSVAGAGPSGANGAPAAHLPPHAAPVEVTSPDAVFLGEVREVVEACMENEDFTVEELARRVAHSRGHLHRRLKGLIDESPSDLIRRMRLERAASLLEARAGSVSRIAYAVGFKSVAHFSNRFSDQFGVRPSRYSGATASSSGDREHA